MNKEDLISQIMGDLDKAPAAGFGDVEVIQPPVEIEDLIGTRPGAPPMPPEEYPGCGPVQALDPTCAGMTEYIGYERMGYLAGYVIANPDKAFLDWWGFDPKYTSLGIIGGRFTAAPICCAADDAVKATNAKLLHLSLPNEPCALGARGSLLVFGAENVSDAKRAVELSLQQVKIYFGGVGMGSTAAYDIQWSANPGQVLQDFLCGVPGKAWGFIDGCPMVNGCIMMDQALKAADVELVHIHTLEEHQFSNEFHGVFVGDSGAVLAAVRRAREVAENLIRAEGNIEPFTLVEPYY